MILKQAQHDKGYTLIELLIVVAILAMLSVAGVFAIGSKIKSARDEKRKADIYDIRMGLEQYYLSEDGYPAVPLIWGEPMKDTLGSVLLSHIGVDPINEGDYKYSYEATSSGDYDICAQLELEELGKLWCLHGLMK